MIDTSCLKDIPEEVKGGSVVPYTSPTGVETELYSIKVVAYAIGRTSQSIRKWEVGGVIPPTPFRINGHRYYSREHLNAIRNSAEKYEIMQGRSIKRTGFSNRLYRDFKELNTYFFG